MGTALVRVVGAMGSGPFVAHSLVHLGGGAVDSTGALAAIGYTLFTVAVVGWALTVLRSEKVGSRRR